MDNPIQNIPLIILGVIFTIAFFIFIIGAIIYLFFKDPEKKESGKRILIKSIYWFVAVLLSGIVFFVLSWLLNQEASGPIQIGGEFPVSPISTNFPPFPQVMRIADVDFNGPFLLDDIIYDQIEDRVVFLTFCKKGEDYDIIYMGDMDEGRAYGQKTLLEHKEYSCWLDNCQDYKDIYIAIFYLDPKDPGIIKQKIQEELSPIFKPLCPVSQSE
jgi:hypothetical protein